MECELVRLAGVPIGLVTSALFYSTDRASSSQEELEVYALLGCSIKLSARAPCLYETGTLRAGQRGADSRVSHWTTTGVHSLLQGPVCSMQWSVKEIHLSFVHIQCNNKLLPAPCRLTTCPNSSRRRRCLDLICCLPDQLRRTAESSSRPRHSKVGGSISWQTIKCSSVLFSC